MPSPRLSVVARPRLVDRLSDGAQGNLVLIAAPAGFGKTTLLTSWHETRAAEDISLAWVSLDPGDNDPTRFWTYVLTALDAVHPGAAADALAALAAGRGTPVAVETWLTPLLNKMNGLGSEVVLVLDDYHVIEAQPIHQGLDFLIEHLPPRLHLVISTRIDPPLALARLRARGHLTEIRARDLRFTSDEAAAFLTQAMGLHLEAEDVAGLEARTEGWIAGLQLAALALRDRADVSSFVAAFTGSNRFVLDYLGEEVLARLPRYLQSFLLRTSVLSRICAPLCSAVVGNHGGQDQKPDCQSLLEELERSNLFLLPLDDERRWYRYHQLFRDVLQGRLRLAVPPEEIAGLHRRASAWFAAEGLVVEAITHAVRGEDWDVAARLLEQHAYAIGFRGEVHTVLEWLNAFPRAFLQTHPDLLMVRTFMLLFTNQLDAASAQLQEAEECLNRHPGDDKVGLARAYGCLARAEMAMMRGETDRASTLAREALALLPEVDASPYRIRPIATLLASMAYRVTGEVGDDAERTAMEPVEALREAGDLFGFMTAITNLARLQMAQGRLRRAAETFALAADLFAEQASMRSLFSGAAYHFGLADLHVERNELEAAASHVARGMDLVHGTVTVQAGAAFAGAMVSARLQEARGDPETAIATLDEFVQLARLRGFASRLVAQAAATQAGVRLRAAASLGPRAAAAAVAQADAWAATRGVKASDQPSYGREAEYLTLARLLIAHGRAGHAPISAAIDLLDRLLAAAQASGRGGSVVEILVLRALARDAGGDRASALADISRALALAEPEGYVRVFVREGPPVADLLRKARDRGVMPAYTDQLLVVLGITNGTGAEPVRSQPTELLETLSGRELEVLRLIAGGASNRDIARELILSIGTVKKHTNNIFGKLAVTSRTQAVARARELGLL